MRSHDVKKLLPPGFKFDDLFELRRKDLAGDTKARRELAGIYIKCFPHNAWLATEFSTQNMRIIYLHLDQIINR